MRERYEIESEIDTDPTYWTFAEKAMLDNQKLQIEVLLDIRDLLKKDEQCLN